MKWCDRCKTDKEISEFAKCSARQDGLQHVCKKCHNNRMKEYRANNLEKTKELARLRYSKNPEKQKIANKEWVNENRGKRNASYANRRALKLKATPSWLTEDQKDQIRSIYESCPKGFHVDHIHPLSGKNSCGLHVPWNLQHLPAHDNLKKSNKVE